MSVLRTVLALLMMLVVLTAELNCLQCFAAEQIPPGQRASKEPATQAEKDWVDSRWEQTILGPLLAGTFPTPGGMVAKGLAIRLRPAQNPAAVIYDTATMDLRAAWSGAFLRFPTVRFGINGAPSAAGPAVVSNFVAAAWKGGKVRYEGLHLHKERVVLEYRVGDARVKESPQSHKEGERLLISRSLEVGPHSTPLHLALIASRPEDKPSSRSLENLQVGISHTNSPSPVLIVHGAGELKHDSESRTWTLEIAPSSVPQHVWIGYGSADTDTLPALTALAQKAIREENDSKTLTELSQAAAGRWHPLETVGQIGSGSQAYVLDTITIPYDNPWKALFFTSGVDFQKDGTAFVCTLHGDVWRVQGIDHSLQKIIWTRFATGLYQPLGLRVVKDRIFVLGRDQITELIDTNHDGEADDYRNFSNLIETSVGAHDYVTSLETDRDGNFYYVDPIGVHRISPDGSKMETLATGWRNPNGMSVGPDGTITATPQQGTWTPSSQISEVKVGGYYGFGGPRVTADRPRGYDGPLCWIPHSVDNSTGSQIWATSDRWGPLAGQLLSLSFGRCALYLVLRETVGGEAQGGVVPLKGRFLSGSMRGSFNPLDGQLYVVGSQGWQTAASRDGSLQRLRYTGAAFHELIGLHSQSNGLRLTFTSPLDRSTAEDPGSYGIERWNYRYTSQYGSKDYSVLQPDREGHDPMTVTSARLLPDGKSVLLMIPDMRPVMQMHVRYNVSTADGAAIRGDLYHTIHHLASPE